MLYGWHMFLPPNVERQSDRQREWMKERLIETYSLCVPLHTHAHTHTHIKEPLCALTAFALAVKEEGERQQKHKQQNGGAHRTTGNNSHWNNIWNKHKQKKGVRLRDSCCLIVTETCCRLSIKPVVSDSSLVLDLWGLVMLIRYASQSRDKNSVSVHVRTQPSPLSLALSLSLEDVVFWSWRNLTAERKRAR